MLYDASQLAPTVYSSTLQGIHDLRKPTTYSSNNNIFVNETLLSIYLVYFNKTIFPFLKIMNPNLTLLDILQLNDINQVQGVNTSILKSYSCSERQLQSWISAAISILVADYALLSASYTFLIFVLG